MKPPVKPFKYKPYGGPAAGWGALRNVTNTTLASAQALKNIKLLLRINHHKGFDCPSCAWGEDPHEGRIRFCENGAKATNWEATSRRVDAAFFAENSIPELLANDDYWLEYQGRLTEPMYYDGASDYYRPISWDDAFATVARHLNALESPNEAAFYTSGRASNEAAFLYQLFVRIYGTNNLPDDSNMCHEASGTAMKESLGVGKGTFTYEDIEQSDVIFIFGQNPGTNSPRMLDPISKAVKRGAKVVAVNPLRETGLERFQAPQNPLQMLTNSSTPTSTAYYRPALGGDMALCRGISKLLLERQRKAEEEGAQGPLDLEFIAENCSGFDEYRKLVEEDTSWDHILEQSGLKKSAIEEMADIYASGKRVLFFWGMGITQHYHGVWTIQEMTNLILLRGQIGKPGAGLSPVRGHSNVQGDRTMGIHEAPAPEFLDRLEKRFNFTCPREKGVNVINCLKAMLDGKIKVFIALGGNFAQSTPDTERTHKALKSCQLTVHINTKLNRSHLVTGREALILPCLGRTDIDQQASGPQAVTVEDTFSMVHASYGQLKPLSPQMYSETAIIAGIANATVGKDVVDWPHLVEDYSRIRDLIADVIPGFEDFNKKIENPGGFYLQNAAGQRHWKTASGRANFMSHPLLESLLREEVNRKARKPDLLLQTMRSHDQFNTTVYSPNDRYRGVTGGRQVLFINREDIDRLGFEEGQQVDIISLWGDDIERRIKGFKLLAYDIPAGQAGAYYPETNPLLPLESYGIGSYTPTSKLIAVCLEKSTAPERII
ncbi:FdhF/YdeP family oxidoreductase [Microbulbifer hainanensis]|uniref:FdhF/YdeP family oxidoreductase n=1 Tax=Microbulbifer hainanensis TaxID=2735675 RepID=UPI00186756AA|nr:FdhF/YdeP family oxidoreductase [Microbulbifer hainanensis]